MSKSVGNVVDPLAIIRDNGADILRLWVASTDYFEDVRIGKEVLAATTDAYRKLRNTFRYLLGALDGFAPTRAVPAADMPELERWVLHRLAELDAELQGGGRGLRVQPLRAADRRPSPMTISRPSSSISARTASIATRRPRSSAAPTGPCSTSPSTRWCAG